MANVNTNMPTQAKDYGFLHPAEVAHANLTDTDVLFSSMANSFSALNLENLTDEKALQLAIDCEESIAGLCHALRFMGKSLITFADNNIVEFSQESLCQAGHGISAISSLIPALHLIERKAEALLIPPAKEAKQ